MEAARIQKRRNEYKKAFDEMKYKNKTAENQCRLDDLKQKLQRLDEDEQCVLYRRRNINNRVILRVRSINGGEPEEWEVEDEKWLGKYTPHQYSTEELKRKVALYREWINIKWYLVKHSMEAKEFMEKGCDRETINELKLGTKERDREEEKKNINDQVSDEEDNNDGKKSKSSVIESNGEALLIIRVIIRLIKKWKSLKEKLNAKQTERRRHVQLVE
jgi:hypothetical protein